MRGVYRSAIHRCILVLLVLAVFSGVVSAGYPEPPFFGNFTTYEENDPNNVLSWDTSEDDIVWATAGYSGWGLGTYAKLSQTVNMVDPTYVTISIHTVGKKNLYIDKWYQTSVHLNDTLTLS